MIATYRSEGHRPIIIQNFLVSFFVCKGNIGFVLCYQEVTGVQTIPKYYLEGFRDLERGLGSLESEPI